jgi:hypothetical protein
MTSSPATKRITVFQAPDNRVPVGFNVYNEVVPCSYSTTHYMVCPDGQPTCHPLKPGEKVCNRTIIIENEGVKLVKEEEEDKSVTYRAQPQQKMALVEGPAPGNQFIQLKTGGDGGEKEKERMPLYVHQGAPPSGSINVPNTVLHQGKLFQFQPVTGVPYDSKTTVEDGKVVIRQIWNVPPPSTTDSVKYVPVDTLSREVQQQFFNRMYVPFKSDKFVSRDLSVDRNWINGQDSKGSVLAQFDFGMQYFPGEMLEQIKNVNSTWIEYWKFLTGILKQVQSNRGGFMESQSIAEREVEVVVLFKNNPGEVKIQEIMDGKTGAARDWKKFTNVMSATLKKILTFFEASNQYNAKVEILTIGSDYNEASLSDPKVASRLQGNYDIMERLCADTGYRAYRAQDYPRPIDLENGILTLLANFYLRERAVYNTCVKNANVPWEAFVAYRHNVLIEDYIRKFCSADPSLYFWAVDIAKEQPTVKTGAGWISQNKTVRKVMIAKK